MCTGSRSAGKHHASATTDPHLLQSSSPRYSSPAFITADPGGRPPRRGKIAGMSNCLATLARAFDVVMARTCCSRVSARRTKLMLAAASGSTPTLHCAAVKHLRLPFLCCIAQRREKLNRGRRTPTNSSCLTLRPMPFEVELFERSKREPSVFDRAQSHQALSEVHIRGLLNVLTTKNYIGPAHARHANAPVRTALRMNVPSVDRGWGKGRY